MCVCVWGGGGGGVKREDEGEETRKQGCHS